MTPSCKWPITTILLNYHWLHQVYLSCNSWHNKAALGCLALFRAKTSSLPNDSLWPLFKQILRKKSFSGKLTAYFYCYYIKSTFLYISVSYSDAFSCGGNYLDQ